MQFIKIATGVFIAISLLACGSSSSPTAEAYCKRGIQCVEEDGQEANTLSQCLSNYNDVFSDFSSSELESAEAALSNCNSQETCAEFFNCVEAFVNN